MNGPPEGPTYRRAGSDEEPARFFVDILQM